MSEQKKDMQEKRTEKGKGKKERKKNLRRNS